MGYLYNGALFHNKKKKDQYKQQLRQTLKTLWKLKEANKKRPQIIWFLIYEIFRLGKSMKTECRLTVGQSWRVGEGGRGWECWLLVSAQFLLREKKCVFKLNRGNGCIIIWVY